MNDDFRERAKEALKLAKAFGFKGTEQALVDILEDHDRLLLASSRDTATNELLARIH